MREMAGRRGEVAEAAAVGDKEAVGWRGEVAEAAAVGDKKPIFGLKKVLSQIVAIPFYLFV
jgi:hypothetical protein